MTQTAVSSRLRMIVRAMGAMVMLGDKPKAKRVRPIFKRHGLEYSIQGYPEVPLSEALHHYLQSGRNFGITAKHFNVHRPKIRRAFRLASELLMAVTNDTEATALGDFLKRLITGASCQGGGHSKSEKRRQHDITRRDPAVLGEFRIDIRAPGVNELFTPRATTDHELKMG